MDLDISSYAAMSLAYDVAFELSREFEQACINGFFDESLLAVLSGCYSAVDYFSNCIAALNMKDEEDHEEHECTLKDYEEAVSVICGHIGFLRSNISEECFPEQVDYRKVHALVGLQAVSDFILHAIDG